MCEYFSTGPNVYDWKALHFFYAIDTLDKL